MPTSRAVRDEVDTFLTYLVNSELALHRTPVSMTPTRVSWHPTSGIAITTAGRRPTTLANYLAWVDAGHYSAVLFDGAVLQITYDVQGSTVVGHRLAYVPCPLQVDYDLLEAEPIGDVVRMYAQSPPESTVLINGAIRFDFDHTAARPGHPASHMTFNSSECRIACHSPVRIGNFVDFVFRNFYSRLWQAHPYLAQMPRGKWGDKTLTADEAERMHIAWSA